MKTEPSSPQSTPVSLVDLSRQFLLNQLNIVEMELTKIDQGNTDPEIIHDLRVASRRILSIIRLCQPFLAKGWAKRLENLLRPIRKATNGLRDIDVLLARVHATGDQNEASPSLVERLSSDRKVQIDKAVHKLSDKTFRRDLKSVLAELKGEDAAIDLLRESSDQDELVSLFDIQDVRLAILGRQAAEITVFHAITPSASALPDEIRADPDLLAGFLEVSESTVHQIRLGFKDWRYALEFLKPALAAKVCDSQIKKAKRFQDQLGTLHDLDLALHKLAELMSEGSGPQNEALVKIHDAWSQERQTLLQVFLKNWYRMTPVWFEEQIWCLLAKESQTITSIQ